MLRDSYIHIPLYYYIGKRTKETRYFYKTRYSFRFPFRSVHTIKKNSHGNKKDLFSPLSSLERDYERIRPLTVLLFFFLRVTSPRKPTKEKTPTTTRGVKTYSVSLCHAFFSLHRDLFVDVALPRKCDEKTRTKRTTPHPSFLLRCNFR